MKIALTSAVLAFALALSACGEQAAQEEAGADPADLATGAVDASSDVSATSQGAQDLTSSAGAGATTGAMDGGTSNVDGEPREGAGGPADVLSQEGDAQAGGGAQ